MGRTRGSSLLELIVAGAVIILVLLSLIGAIAFGLEGVRSADGHQQAVYHARRLMELIRAWSYPIDNVVSPSYLGFQDLPTDRVLLHAAPFDNDFPTTTGYTRNLFTEPLSTDPTNYQSKIYRVRVIVYWEAKRRVSQFQISGLYRAIY